MTIFARMVILGGYFQFLYKESFKVSLLTTELLMPVKANFVRKRLFMSSVEEGTMSPAVYQSQIRISLSWPGGIHIRVCAERAGSFAQILACVWRLLFVVNQPRKVAHEAKPG
jgi:hypothetical protein